MKKAFNLFSATLSKVHWTFFTLAGLCAVAMMAGCKGGTATEADSLSQKEMLITPPGYFDKYSIPSEGPIDTMGLDTMIFTFCEVDAEFPGSEDSLRFPAQKHTLSKGCQRQENRGYSICVIRR